MEKKGILAICLMFGFISAGFISPPFGSAHDNAENHSHMHLTCNSSQLVTSTPGEYAGTQVVLNCSGCKTACFGDQENNTRTMNEASEWQEDLFFDKYSY
jgi:hypothetical protein